MLPRLALIAILLTVLMLLSCGEPTTAPPPDSGPKDYTGILINAQQEGTIKSLEAAGRSVTKWTIVDAAGTKVLSEEDILPKFREGKGVIYEWKRNLAFEGKNQWLGDKANRNVLELSVENMEISSPESEEREVVFTVSDRDAGILRSDPVVRKLVDRCMIVILLGKLGE